MQTATVLLTGFGPFPGVAHNASAILVRRLAGVARNRTACRVTYSVLPTQWQAAPRRLRALYRRHAPDIALHFGVSAHATGIQLERRAVNICKLMPDAAGCLPAAEHLVAGGAPHALATLPMDRILQRLAALHIPSAMSDDAGGYLCNALLYHAIAEADAIAGCRAGFIHIPSHIADRPAHGTVMTWDTVLAGALAVLETCLEDARLLA